VCVCVLFVQKMYESVVHTGSFCFRKVHGVGWVDCSSWCEDSKGYRGNAFIVLLASIYFLPKKLLAVSLSGDK